ncbi:bifunctional glutathionylspermidine amidase/glutathionylspermidine synthetase [Achlya hypogyna]|uniref:Bifunctional glutathionylspermidine amidase/glutathionylspermidine synthetase n=1 Tax=Achlya hypogyna TaxID=1202772 RepID=A0A1V9ZFH4_ACHHY|nr:bifunctional glutathionylspermidine amidase/glutathionylspermidine synthetase [Achlya hypogyna]
MCAVPAEKPQRCPFGTVLGVSDDVCVYSCWNAACPKRSKEHFHNGIFTGLQWQCVELARRYLVVRSGVTFSSIRFAYQIFGSSTAFERVDGGPVTVTRCPNGATARPTTGSLLIWDHGGTMKETGHVAVIVRVEDTFVDIIEQNHDDTVWPSHQDYSRRLVAATTPDGYCIAPASVNETLLGWVNIDTTNAAPPNTLTGGR